MSPLAMLVRLGKDAADQRLSASRTLNPRSVTDVATVFKRATSLQHAGRLLGLDSPRQFVCVAEGLSVSVISATMPAEADASLIIGMLGDDLCDATPVAFCASLFDAYVSVLVSPTDATTFELPVSATDLDTLAGPPDDQGVRADPSIARLSFDAGGAAPMACAVRLFCPLPVGVPIPANLKLDHRDDAFAQACPVYEVWRAGMYHAVTHNDGFSISEGNTLVVGTEIDKAGFGQLPIAQEVRPTVELLRPGAEHTAQIRAYWKTVRDDAHLRLGHQHPDVDTAAAGGGGGTRGDGTLAMDVATAFATALKDNAAPVSLKDKDTIEGNKLHAAAIRLLFARVGKDEATGEDITIVPPLTEGGEKLFGMSATRAAGEHKQLVEETLAELQSPSGMQNTSNAAITLKSDDFFGHFGQTIRTSTWLTDSINAPNSNPKSYLSLLAFAPRTIGSLQYQQMKESDNLHSVQLAAEEHATKRVAKSTELCLELDVKSRDACLSTIANFRASYLPFVGAEAYEKSILGKGLQALAALCLDHHGKTFFATCDTIPQVPFNVLTTGDDYLRHLTTIASRTVLRRAVVEGKAVAPGPYLSARSFVDALLEPLKLAIMRNHPGTLREVPYAFNKWFPSGTEEAADKGPKKREAASADTRSSKTSKKEDDPNGPISKGFLAWTGKGNPKHLPIFWPDKKTGEPARLCVFFCSRGCVCKFRQCSMHHPKKLTDLPADQRKQLEKEISVTQGLDFAPGHGPAGAS